MKKKKLKPVLRTLKLKPLLNFLYIQDPPPFNLSLSVLVNNPKFSDCTFQCNDGSSIFGHKAILSRSQYFSDLFSAIRGDSFKISGTLKSNLAIFEFLYGNEEFPEDILKEVILLAVSRFQNDISNHAQKQLARSISYSNFIDLYQFVQKNDLQEEVIGRAVAWWISFRVALMRKTAQWKSLPETLREEFEGMKRPGNWVEEEKDEREKCIIS